MKEDLYDDLFDEKEEKTDFQALFFKYVIHWPWFIASILICMALAFIYLRYQAPVYEVASSVLIKEDDNKKSANNALAAMQDFGMFSMTSNFDNEDVKGSIFIKWNIVTEWLFLCYVYIKIQV